MFPLPLCSLSQSFLSDIQPPAHMTSSHFLEMLSMNAPCFSTEQCLSSVFALFARSWLATHANVQLRLAYVWLNPFSQSLCFVTCYWLHSQLDKPPLPGGRCGRGESMTPTAKPSQQKTYMCLLLHQLQLTSLSLLCLLL